MFSAKSFLISNWCETKVKIVFDYLRNFLNINIWKQILFVCIQGVKLAKEIWWNTCEKSVNWGQRRRFSSRCSTKRGVKFEICLRIRPCNRTGEFLAISVYTTYKGMIKLIFYFPFRPVLKDLSRILILLNRPENKLNCPLPIGRLCSIGLIAF